jgi:hypothetical protein
MRRHVSGSEEIKKRERKERRERKEKMKDKRSFY